MTCQVKIKWLVRLTTTALIFAMLCFSGCNALVREKSATDNQNTKLYDTGSITLYRFDGGTVGMAAYDDDWYNEFLDYYQTEYGGRVSTVAVEWDGWEEQFNTDVASGTAPDLIPLFEKNFVDLLNRDLLVSVEDLQKEGIEGLDHPSLFLKQDLAARIYSSGGKTYSIACAYAEADMIFVNEDLFSRYGVKSPYDYYSEGQWNLNAFIQCAEAMARDLNGDGKNDIYGYYGWDPSCFIVSTGGKWIDFDDKGKIQSFVDTEATRNGFKLYRQLYGGRYATDRYARWLLGQTAMISWTPQSEYSNIAESRLDFNWSVVPFPVDNSVNDGVHSGRCYGWALPQASVNRQCCVNYVIAINSYSVTHPDPAQSIYGGAFQTSQLEMFSDCTQNLSVPIYNGVGQLNTVQWDMWGALSDPTIPFEEVMDSIIKETDRQIKSATKKQ